MSSAHAEQEQDGAVLSFTARLPPTAQRGQLVFGDGAVAEARGGRLLEGVLGEGGGRVARRVCGDGAVAEARGGRLLEGVLGEGEVRLADFETATAGERGLCGFNV